jgi:acyl-[acyl-carrier-protein]-phospholipid O-acyltransferase/long-chain-fatty-acid--[acyl-carrier-protein] ligase
MTEAPQKKRPLNQRIAGSVIRFVGVALIKLIYRVCTVTPENVPESGGVLLLPNHVTFADAFFITAATPRKVRFVMDASFMANPAVAWFCNVFETVTIRKEQSREALRITIDALKNGDAVCFFPEGQLSRTGALNELRRGVELIAKKAAAPLVPMWLDGAWGSIFSFERGRFFKKQPYSVPYGMTVAFGEPIDPENATLEAVRDGIFKAAAATLRRRFPADTDPAWINGYQIGQIAALPRRTPFGVLKNDPLIENLPALFDGFSGQFGSLAEVQEIIGKAPKNWVGGETLRTAIESGNFQGEIDFYDFSDRAMEPLEIPNVRHFPCLAIAGRVISMSMPDPPQPHKGSESQRGNKPNSYGKLLPGWFAGTGADGSLRIHGPATGSGGLRLPAGLILDDEGFILRG